MEILVVFFSQTGGTASLAKQIQKIVGGDIQEILTVTPYPSSYTEVCDIGKKEIKNRELRPIKTKFPNISSYTTVFIGSPIWWGTLAPPVATFLSECNLSGKTIVPFCTHGGGGNGSYFKEIATRCPGSKVLAGFEVSGSSVSNAEGRVVEWLKKIGLKTSNS
jgi:flavodoxin